ncbi:MAG: cysteine desulfurase [Clostridia bacterium]|nr:cysteine desulfurase [Clostridia bacterium]
MDTIYFDHAATTPVDSEVLEKMIPYFREGFGNADSPHAFGRKAMNAVDFARDKVAELLHAKPNEIYFTSGGTEADNWAMLSGAYAMREQGRDRVILSSIEHHAVLAAAEKLEKEGFSVTRLPVNENGEVTAEALSAEIDEKTGLVAVMAANNETGVLQPVETLCKIAKDFGALFFTDAVQYAPYMPIDVKALGADMLSLSSHKFYGPKGCGVLYIRSGVKAKGLVVGGEQERGLRGGTTNVPAVVGLAVALEKNTLEMQRNNEKIRALRELFLREISTLDGVTVNGDTDKCLPSVLNVRFKGVNNADFVYNMDLRGVCLAAGSACASASIKPSHVLLAMGLNETQAKESVRFSFGKDNTEEEILRGAALTKETVERLRGL